MSTWLTIPTAGNRRTLLPLVDQCGIPRERIVLVHTDPTSPPVPGCKNLTDLGSPNIHRWWNFGIGFATLGGATVVVVANDDISVSSPADLERLAAGAAPISYVAPGREGHCRLTGWCWALRTDSGLRPDESYSWFYGDDQLELDAIAAGHLPAPVPVDVEHHKADEPLTVQLRRCADEDQRLFYERHPGL